MKRLFSALLILPALVLAQGAALSITGPAAVPAGGAVTLTVSLASGGGPAGLQWDMSGVPLGATVASSVAGKTTSCTSTRCIFSGINATAIADGAVATIKYTQPASAPPTVALAATLGATPAGTAATVTAPTTGVTVPLQSNCDLNGDGKVDQTDVGLAIQQALQGSTINIVQIIQEIIAANGGTCQR